MEGSLDSWDLWWLFWIRVAGLILVNTTPTRRLRKHVCRAKEWMVKRRSGYRYRRNTQTIPKVREEQQQDQTPSDGETYVYRPLASERHIRVFELDAGDAQERLCGGLVPMDLSGTALSEYEALSHVWGATQSSSSLWVDGCYMCVTPQIAAMLRQLRLRDRPRRLWVDVFCINQKDDAERNAQVKIMDLVYRKAKLVIIWLGSEDHWTADAFELMGEAYGAIERATGPDGSCPTLPRLLEQSFPAANDPRWAAFQVLLSCPWFRRTWILQEVALAQEAEVRCGSHSRPWVYLGRIVVTMLFSGTDRAFGLNVFWANVVITVDWDMHTSRSSETSRLELMSTTRASGVSRPHDKVFALLGLAGDGTAFKHLVKYEDSVELLYLQLAEGYLTRPNNDLSALHLASDPAWRKHKALPSWVMNFDGAAVSATPLCNFSCANFGPPCTCRPPSVTNDRKILSIRGIVKGTVGAAGRHIPLRGIGMMGDAGVALLFLEQWRRMANRRLRHYPTGEAVDEAFARTIVADCPKLVRSMHNVRETYFAYTEQFRHRLQTTPLHEDDGIAGTFAYHTQMGLTSWRRSFFLTRNGYMGIGPYFLRPTDIVVRFHGAGTPFVVRKLRTGNYLLVGEAYVHGMMEPEECLSVHWEDLSLE